MGMANVYREPTELERAMTKRTVDAVQSALTTALGKIAKNDPQLQAADYKKMCEARLKNMIDNGQVAGGRIHDPVIAHSFYVDKDGSIRVHWRGYRGGRSYTKECTIPRRIRGSRRRSRVYCKRYVLGTISVDVAVTPVAAPVEKILLTVALGSDGFLDVESDNGNS